MADSETDQAELPLDELAARLTVELNLISETAIALEHIVSVALLDGDKDISDDVVSELQKFDLMIQSLAALSGLLTNIAPTLAGLPAVQIGTDIRNIPLKDLASRLNGETMKYNGLCSEIDLF